MLGEKEGVVFGHYPYNPLVTDMHNIPVASSLDGDDYMFGLPVSGVSSANPDVNMTMKHALAFVSISFEAHPLYAGDCILNYLSLSGEGIAAEGLLDAADGSLEAEASALEFPALEHSFAEKLTENVLIVPSVVEENRQEVKVACIIDGDSKEIVSRPG